MRPVFFDFQEDARAWTAEDQFMFGPDILVAPILHYHARSRKVYLPVGASWRDAWTDRQHEGGSALEVDALIERIPVYIRNDRKLPFAGV
jgi:alpha-D-xyloside xylohydrolase